MVISIIYALVSVIIVSVISLVGLIIISVKEEKLRKSLYILVALAIGALFGSAFIHLIPEAFETSESALTVSLMIIAGMLVFFILEKYLNFHHEHEECRHIGDEGCNEKGIKPIGRLILVSDGLHNFIDGIIIGVSYLVDIKVGIATTIAVILHEIPQEIGDFGILLHAGYTKNKALLYNFLSALLAVAGVLLVAIIGSSLTSLLPLLLAFTAGMFIYIASVDLVPELHKRRSTAGSIIEIITIIIGILLMYALTYLG